MTGAEWAAGAAWAAPWWLQIAASAWRWRNSPSLDDVPPEPPEPAPLLSVIVPARDEAQHIADCIRSILSSSYPALHVVVVDDHSGDSTATLARDAAGDDPRLTVVCPPPLPSGWLGKQWACDYGALHARGSILLFTDADVRHAPDLHARIVNTMARHGDDFLSVTGEQEAATFWERVAQPFVFPVLAQRFGGPGAVNRSSSRYGKIANGQCLAFRRSAYDAFGGHASVRDRAAEDLAFAQELFAAGYRTRLTLGMRQMSTRMYGSLRELVAGWGKNVYAAGRETLPPGRFTSPLLPLLVPLPALWALLPPLALVAVATGVAGGRTLAFGAVASAALLTWFAGVSWRMRVALPYALLFPLGAVIYLYIALSAVRRGDRVQWKGRTYDVRPPASPPTDRP
ncbi:MAG: glycosyltransferase family A protein [Gemmatimonadaceae bacterium]